MARISKDPEIRKKEILNAAMTLFYEKGYEKTSMADIAAKIGVAQGLCYRYFPSKENLFDCSVQEYAQMLVEQMRPVLCDSSLTLTEKLEQMPAYFDFEKTDMVRYKVFHSENSQKMHTQLFLKVCELVVPLVEDLLRKANQKGETHLRDPATAASFAVYGQLGILLDKQIDGKDKIAKLKAFLNDILHL